MTPIGWFRVGAFLAGLLLWAAVPVAWQTREHAGVLFVMLPAVAMGLLLVITGILGPERFSRLGERRRRRLR